MEETQRRSSHEESTLRRLRKRGTNHSGIRSPSHQAVARSSQPEIKCEQPREPVPRMPQKTSRKILAKNASQPKYFEPSFQTKVGLFQFLDVLALTSVFGRFFFKSQNKKLIQKLYRHIVISRGYDMCTRAHFAISLYR